MPLYKYIYQDDEGYTTTDEIGAADIFRAAREARRRMKGAREFILWDRNDPPPAITDLLEKRVGRY